MKNKIFASILLLVIAITLYANTVFIEIAIKTVPTIGVGISIFASIWLFLMILSSILIVNFFAESPDIGLKTSTFEAVTEWQKKTFGQPNTQGLINHLQKELIELTAADSNNDEKNIKEEVSDCFILLFQFIKAKNLSIEDIDDSILEKLEILKNRKWNKPDADGVIKHIK